MVDLNGGIRTKNITISAVDLASVLGLRCEGGHHGIRPGNSRMLHVIAYTFELAGFINISQRSLTLYTRETVLENLPPLFCGAVQRCRRPLCGPSRLEADQKEARRQFRIEIMRKNWKKKPGGYDFLFSCSEDGQGAFQAGQRHGVMNHGTICLVRRM